MANNIKISRYESIILNVINKAILFEVNDKIAKHGRVTYVKLTNDISIAHVYIDCLDRTKIELVTLSLNKISGLFRNKVAEAMDIYKTPKIIFKIDKTIDYAEKIDKIIKDIHSKE